MGLGEIIAVSVVYTIVAVLLLYMFCDMVVSHRRKKKRQREWYIETLMSMMRRLDDIDIELENVVESLLMLNEEIYEYKEKQDE